MDLDGVIKACRASMHKGWLLLAVTYTALAIFLRAYEHVDAIAGVITYLLTAPVVLVLWGIALTAGSKHDNT